MPGMDEDRYKVVRIGLPIIIVIVAVPSILVKPPLWKAPPLFQSILFWSVFLAVVLAVPKCVQWFFGDRD